MPNLDTWLAEQLLQSQDTTVVCCTVPCVTQLQGACTSDMSLTLRMKGPSQIVCHAFARCLQDRPGHLLGGAQVQPGCQREAPVICIEVSGILCYSPARLLSA